MIGEVAGESGNHIPQRTCTSSCADVYLRLHLFFEDIPALELSHSTLRQHLQQGLTQAFGKIGGAIPFEVLSLQQGSAIAFLKADKRDLTKLRAACTLITSCEGQACHFQVEAVSPFLASLAKDSRAFAAQLPFPCQ
ncbi:g5821 [Coccomyxa viridis]|uniref:G5821 protein n=1 Tax=Coccomyxa viridis TaxID=1274662 RepID=A0ABP1FTV7_9CHLO